MDSKLTETDIIPHIVKPGYKSSFSWVDMKNRAIAFRGLNPLNWACLIDPDIFVSKPKNFPRYPWMDDANEEPEEAVLELSPMPPPAYAKYSYTSGCIIFGPKYKVWIGRNIFCVTFQHVVCQEARNERGAHLKD